MSLPDTILIARAGFFPKGFPGFPHRLLLLPNAKTMDDLGRAGTAAAVFLIEPDCASEILNDPALSHYINTKTAILACARRARDLPPLLRRASALKRRQYSVEVMQ
jgi:hypothetical protein